MGSHHTARPQYGLLAELFAYPQADYGERVRRAAAALSQAQPEAATILVRFLAELPLQGDDTIGEDDLLELQELFTRSFEVQAVTTLDIGYVCFGDDYKRAEMLVNLNREHRAAGVDCGSELPDHLPNVLRLLARWDDLELAAELVRHLVLPAVRQMVCEFSLDRMTRRDALYRKHHKTLIDVSPLGAAVFQHPLAALDAVLTAEFGAEEAELPARSADFLSSVEREMEIEERGAGARPSAVIGNGLPRRESRHLGG